MRDFDWEGFKNREFVVNCKTEKETLEFVNFCNKNNLDCLGTDKGYNWWDKYKENTCCAYYSGGVAYGEVSYYKELGIKILEWRKEEDSMFNKKDLEGKFVELRNGERGIVLNSHIKAKSKGLIKLGWYNEDLQEKYGDEEWDIIKIFKIEDHGGVLDLFNDPEKYAELIWEREEIDWNNVPKYTKVQVRDDETDKWKNRYFIKYIKEDKEPFYCSLCKKDEFTNFISTKIPYKHCRLYKEDQH